MKTIPLTQGYVAVIDDRDYELVRRYTWQALVCKSGIVYASHGYTINRKCRKVLMHRMILGAKGRQVVDHEDGNGLNNKRSNIRIGTGRDNSRNSRRFKGRSKYKGVTVRDARHRKKYRARISGNSGERIHIGDFHSEIEAARAYDVAAMRIHKKFARTNQSQYPSEFQEPAA